MKEKIKNINPKIKKYIIISIIALLVIALITYYCCNAIVINYKLAVSEADYFAHALGGIDKNTYTNSKEALEQSYKAGFKFYEADVRLTSDKKLVLVSGWAEKDYKEHLGLEYNSENHIMDYDTFKNTKVKGKYTTLSFKELLEFMKQHKEIYVLIDIGSKKAKETKEIYQAIIKDCENDDKLLQRLIVNGYTTSQIKAIKETYDFKLVNMVWQADDKREKSIKNKKKFVEFCKKNDIISVSMASSSFTKDLGYYFKKKGLMVYVYTVNSQKKASQYLKASDLIGTDFLHQ